MWLLSNWSFVDDLKAKWLSWHFPYGISHYEELLQRNQLVLIGGPQVCRDGIELDFVVFVISCEGCLLGHVIVPNLVFSQPLLPSLWWLPHSFLNGVIQSSGAWSWDIIGVAFY